MAIGVGICIGIGTCNQTLGTPPDLCKPSGGQYLYNYSFDCGTAGWGFAPAYPATITDNGDGSVHLKTDSNFGSLVPEQAQFPADNWILECKVRNIVGNGKLSYRRPNGTWVSHSFDTNGIHSHVYSGAIAEIHVGADGDINHQGDYEYISLRKQVRTQTPCMTSENTPYGTVSASRTFGTVVVTLNGDIVTLDGEVVLYNI